MFASLYSEHAALLSQLHSLHPGTRRPNASEWPKSKICHPRNKLSSKRLFEMGEIAHKIVLAIRADKEDKIREPLQQLGFRSRKQATEHLSRLGRTGRLVWATENFQHLLPYIDARTLMLCPLVHALLHGLMQDLFVLSFGKWGDDWKAKPFDDDPHPVVFSNEALKRVQVRPIPTHLRCFLTVHGFNV
jgi:hypothetical protein